MKTSVLIVGAGPTGLMAACQLKRFGVDCIIIDSKSGPTIESRALVVQSRTLEIYEQMGISSKAVEDGQTIERANLIVEGKIARTIPIGEIGKGLSPFPFLLVYEQFKNEKLLLEHLKSLGGDVWWNTKLAELSQNDNEVNAVVEKKGEQIKIQAGYVIGADGAKSAVRHQLDFTFTGGTYENIFFVADTEAEWDFGYEQLFLCISKNTFSGMFAMKGYHRFRLIGIMPKDFQNSDNVTLDEIEQEVVSKMGVNVDFKNTSWFSIYRLHHRCVDSFSKGRVFLAGDAAHIHSPVGGQGMNTGLQDVYNLAWKLAYVIKGVASPKLLDTYNEERLPFAKRLVRTTDRMFSFVTSENIIIEFLRVKLLPPLSGILLKRGFFRKFMFMTVSQIGIEYRNRSLSLNGGNDFLKDAPEPGDRTPYVFLHHNGNRVSIYELLKETRFHLLIFDDEAEINGFESEFVKVIYVRDRNKNTETYKKFGVKNKGVFLIRPDNYIGFRSSNVSSQEIKKYLSGRAHFNSV